MEGGDFPREIHNNPYLMSAGSGEARCQKGPSNQELGSTFPYSQIIFFM